VDSKLSVTRLCSRFQFHCLGILGIARSSIRIAVNFAVSRIRFSRVGNGHLAMSDPGRLLKQTRYLLQACQAGLKNTLLTAVGK
jgi:hypothetical protein